MPATFELLAANVAQFEPPNVTLLNLAASDSTRIVGTSMPDFETGLKNYCGAAMTSAPSALQVMNRLAGFARAGS